MQSLGIVGIPSNEFLGKIPAKNLPRTCPGCQDYAGQVLAKILPELAQDLVQDDPKI